MSFTTVGGSLVLPAGQRPVRTLPIDETFTYADGPIPQTWIDAHVHEGKWHEPMSIVDNALAIESFGGPDWTAGWQGYSGRRSILYCPTDSDLLDGVLSITNYVDPAHDFISGPCLYVNPASRWMGIGGFFNPLGFWEFGLIGKNPRDWTYLDLTIDTIPADTSLDFELRSDGVNVALYYDGTIVAGPVPIDPTLIDSVCHGVQIDTEDEEDVGLVDRVRLQEYSGTLPTRTAVDVETVGTANKGASSLSIALAYPSGIQAGDLLVAFIGHNGGGGGDFASADWTFDTNSPVAQPRIAILHKTATGSEAGTATFTKGSGAGTIAGCMVRLSAVRNNDPATQAHVNTLGSTTPAVASNTALSPYLHGLICVMANADTTITLPSGWSNLAITSAGGTAVTLRVGERDVNAQFPPGTRFTALPNNGIIIAGDATATLGTSANATTAVCTTQAALP